MNLQARLSQLIESASLTVRPGGSYPEAGSQHRSNHEIAVTLIGSVSDIVSESCVDFEGFCGTGKPRENLWATSRPDQNQAVFLA